MPGKSVDSLSNVEWVSVGPGSLGNLEGLPVLKPPYGKITAIDLNTGDHLWWIPNGETPEAIRNHKLLKGVDVGNTGAATHATALVTRTLLIYGEGRGGRPRMYAVDKRTGKQLATVDIPAPTVTAPMTFMHDGVQYIVSAIGGGEHGPALVALRLPQ